MFTPGLLNVLAPAASPLSLTVRDSRRLVLEIGFEVNHFPWVKQPLVRYPYTLQTDLLERD